MKIYRASITIEFRAEYEDVSEFLDAVKKEIEPFRGLVTDIIVGEEERF